MSKVNKVFSTSLRDDSSAWRRFQSNSFMVVGEVEGEVEEKEGVKEDLEVMDSEA